jgi:hypothetical protein
MINTKIIFKYQALDIEPAFERRLNEIKDSYYHKYHLREDLEESDIKFLSGNVYNEDNLHSFRYFFEGGYIKNEIHNFQVFYSEEQLEKRKRILKVQIRKYDRYPRSPSLEYENRICDILENIDYYTNIYLEHLEEDLQEEGVVLKKSLNNSSKVNYTDFINHFTLSMKYERTRFSRIIELGDLAEHLRVV